ncbi:probable ATP-dependent RNA helicase vasa-like [Branchiostoma floridae]|uniref:Probable ATP-dependent RNA helicase vasa-like n=1 Tax=Branchiostoma floridae TaxID=7739 RepID=A0A9J7HUN6_BRAFL|nr:probable ATP-dependent RNA helicase vasa-like [Branchiostoma floridae]
MLMTKEELRFAEEAEKARVELRRAEKAMHMPPTPAWMPSRPGMGSRAGASIAPRNNVSGGGFGGRQGKGRPFRSGGPNYRRDGPRGRCFNCNETGHHIKDCPTPSLARGGRP